MRIVLRARSPATFSQKSHARSRIVFDSAAARSLIGSSMISRSTGWPVRVPAMPTQ
jgi:hypothetical protein